MVYCKSSNADRGSRLSIAIAREMLESDRQATPRAVAQNAGKIFTDATEEFLKNVFLQLDHLRPGNWKFSTSQAKPGIAAYYQYEHLVLLDHRLENLKHASKDLRAMFAGNYLVKPDIVIARLPVNDSLINDRGIIVEPDDNIALHTPLRNINNQTALLHASVTCKWTFRSDRAQNARTEALNLIRDRKGHTPHIVVVTGEPLPSRLASLAMGTGDIDCVYHMALLELESAIHKYGDEGSQDMFDTLVHGRRLRDISDLPFDLAI